MLVLGEERDFSKEELRYIKKQFTSIDFIKYNNVKVETVIFNINASIEKNNKKLIILNTKANVKNELLLYLTKLEQEEVNYISIKNFIESYLYKCYIPTTYSDISFLENIKPFSKEKKILKFLIDYPISLIILFLTSPIFLYSIYKIKKESPGSIIFKQQRIGLNGKEFTCYKFRSMHENSHYDPYTRENDSRIYPWGKIMRKFRIDELPQLINILKGDMYLIGPRAEWNLLVTEYEVEIPYYHQRHIMKPGITGWAQVNYSYGANIYDTKQKLMYDLYYIKNWSLWLEIKTIWKTIMVIMRRKGI